MKQIIQDIKSGRTVLEEVPVPQNVSFFSILGNGAYARGVRKGEPD